MRWLASDWDHRANRDDSPELMKSLDIVDQLPPLVRQLVESSDWLCQITEDGRVSKAIRRRAETIGEDLDPSDMDPEDYEVWLEAQEDALNHGNDHMPSPRDAWDKVFWVEQRTRYIILPENEYGEREVVVDQTDPRVPVEMAAPWYPTLRDKRLKGYACNLEAAVVRRGISGRVLYKAVGDAVSRGKVTKAQAARLWELWRIEKFLRNKV